MRIASLKLMKKLVCVVGAMICITITGSANTTDSLNVTYDSKAGFYIAEGTIEGAAENRLAAFSVYGLDDDGNELQNPIYMVTYETNQTGYFKEEFNLDEEDSLDCVAKAMGFNSDSLLEYKFFYASEKDKTSKLSLVNATDAAWDDLCDIYEDEPKLFIEEETYKKYYKDEKDKLTAAQKEVLFKAVLSERNKLTDKKFVKLDDFSEEANKQLAFVLIKSASGTDMNDLAAAFSNVLSLENAKLYAEAETAGVNSEAIKGLAGTEIKNTDELYDAYNKSAAFAMVDSCKDWKTLQGTLDKYIEYLVDDTKYYNSCDKEKLAVYLADEELSNAKEIETAIKAFSGSNKDTSGSYTRPSGGGGGGGGSMGITGYESTPKEEAAPQTNEIFSDLTDCEWAREAIESLYKKGVVSGMGNNRFEANSSVTREQFVKMILGAFSLYKDGCESEFNDADKNSWEYPYISCAYELGIVMGDNYNSFGIGENITREDMAVIIKRAADIAEIEMQEINEVNLTDKAEISDYALSAVEAMTKAGIITGYDDGSFRPKSFASRAEAAVMLYRAMGGK